MRKRMTAIAAATLMSAVTLTTSALALGSINTATGVDTTRNCVQNGFHYKPTSGTTAVGPHCYATPDSTLDRKLAPVVSTKTKADLQAVQKRSPLDPKNYLAEGTVAKRLVADAPRATNSRAIATFVSDELPRKYLPDQFDSWLRMGANIGGGVAAHDNIPIYTVDSSNPYQEFATFNSNDARVTNFPKIVEMNSGKIPLPSWAKPSDGGDHSLAIYDVATGVWRSYFNVSKDAKGVWQYASSGYWYGDPATQKAGDRNYWLSLIQGTSSVIGMSNELTQIGFQEVKNSEINHMVSFTFPDYIPGASFPAKQSDGRLDPAAYPNAPKAGQVFTFPKNFDIDAYAKANGIDATTKALMKAVQLYGGIVADRNNFVMAANFENPYGMGVRATNPNANPWRDDPVVSAKINGMDLNKFPWAQTEWLPANYAGDTMVVPGSTTILTPTRVLDTRNTLGGVNRSVKPGETILLQVAGKGGVPASGVGSVSVKVSVTGGTSSGYITVGDGVTAPTGSALNYLPGKTVSNLAVSKVDAAGRIAIKNNSSGSVHFVVDVESYSAAGTVQSPGMFVPTASSTRVADTRLGLKTSKERMGNGTVNKIKVTGVAGIPTSGVSAVTLTVTAVNPTANGYITAYPGGAAVPPTSSLNFMKGVTTPNTITVKVASDGTVDFKSVLPGATDMLVDVAGYYKSGSATQAGSFVALQPLRAIDTRSTARVMPGTTVNVSIAKALGKKPSELAGAMVNVTATTGYANGNVVIYPTSSTRTNSSALNWTKGETRANGVFVKPDANGNITLYNSSGGSVHFIVDVQGYFVK